MAGPSARAAATTIAHQVATSHTVAWREAPGIRESEPFNLNDFWVRAPRGSARSKLLLAAPDAPGHEACDDRGHPQHPILDGEAIDRELMNQTLHDRPPAGAAACCLAQSYASSPKKYC